MNNQTNILIIDDHELTIAGIKNMLHPYPRYQIVGTARDGLEAYSVFVETNPDLVILDLMLPKMNGEHVIQRLLKRNPKLHIIVLTAKVEESQAMQILKKGVLGYVLKNSSQQHLLAAIQHAINGKRYIDPSLHSEYLIANLKNKSNKKSNILTARELQVLKLIAEGACNRTIAETLFISPKTVDTHRFNMMRKLGVNKATQLIQVSTRLNLI